MLLIILGVAASTSHLFDSAPTLVERQRENLTQRLKREFGLFLSDDEEQEKARKQGKTATKKLLVGEIFYFKLLLKQENKLGIDIKKEGGNMLTETHTVLKCL